MRLDFSHSEIRALKQILHRVTYSGSHDLVHSNDCVRVDTKIAQVYILRSELHWRSNELRSLLKLGNGLKGRMISWKHLSQIGFKSKRDVASLMAAGKILGLWKIVGPKTQGLPEGKENFAVQQGQVYITGMKNPVNSIYGVLR